MKKWKKIVLWPAGLCLTVAALALVCDEAVSVNARGRVFGNVDEVPHRVHGLVLGTSPFWGNHRRNIYFENRIRAAAGLYRAEKVDTLIVSGGNYTNEGGYNEPVAMRDSLVAHGVPAEVIKLDYDGTRTLKSIENIRNVYRTDSIIIISQRYHNERAIYQADHLGIDAIAFDAVTPRRLVKLIQNRGREVLARVKLFIDMSRD